MSSRVTNPELPKFDAELSEVVWNFTLKATGLGKPEIYWSVTIVLGFAAFAGVSVAVLISMEGLSAFLHALRLHWFAFPSCLPACSPTFLLFTAPVLTYRVHWAVRVCLENNSIVRVHLLLLLLPP